MLPLYERTVRVARKNVAPIWTRSFPVSKQPQTIGEHLKKQRFSVGLRQSQAAQQLGVSNQQSDAEPLGMQPNGSSRAFSRDDRSVFGPRPVQKSRDIGSQNPKATKPKALAFCYKRQQARNPKSRCAFRPWLTTEPCWPNPTWSS